MISGIDTNLPKLQIHQYNEVTQNPISRSESSVSHRPKPNHCLFYTCITLAFMILIYIFFIRTGLIPQMISWLETTLSNMYIHNKVGVMTILFLLVFLMIVTALPSQTVICIMASLIIKDIKLNFVFLTVTSIIASISIYLIARRWFYVNIHKKLNDNKYYIVLKDESIKSPWKAALITRLMYIPAGLKDYILVMAEIPFTCYVGSAIIGHAIYISELLLVACELKDINQLFEDNKSWGQKTLGEKASFLFGLVMVVFTFGFMAYLGYWVKKKAERRHVIVEESELNITA